MPAAPAPIAAAVAPSAAALAAMVEASPQAFALIDPAGTLRWANRAFSRLTGLAPGSVVGRRFGELLYGAEAEAATCQWLSRRFADGQSFEPVELPCRSADGRTLWFSISGGPVDAARPAEGCFVTFSDVTALHREVHERQRLAELLDMAQEFGRIGVWERDLRTLQGYWDRHVFRFWGLEPGDTPDFEAAARAIHPDDDAANVVRASFAKAGTYTHRYRVLRADGTVRLLHSQWEVKNGADGTPERAIGIMMDDTEVYELARSASDAHEQFNMAVALADIAIWRHDLKANRMYYNARAWEVLALPPRAEGLSLQEVRALIHPDDLPSVVASAEQALATDRPTDMEARYRRSDGTWRYVLNRRVVQRDVNGKPIAFVGVALDVTEQVEGTRRAVELSRRLESAARAAGIGLWTVEVATGRLEWNDRMSALFGLGDAPAPATFVEWLERCVHPDDFARVRSAAVDWLKNGHDLMTLEYRTRRKDNGEVRWLVNRSDFDPMSERRYVFGVTQDITEQRATIDALREAGERSALAQRGIGMGAWEFDLRTGATYWNEQMFQLRGLAPQSRPLDVEERRALVHPDDRAIVDQALHEAMAGTQGQSTYDFRVRLPYGEYRWLASRSTTLYDDQGRPTRRIGVNWDITDSKTAELARQEKAIALRESESKSRFLARMSHELRTPLNAVLGFTQLLYGEAERVDPAVLRLRLGHIRSAGQHLLSLINDVLELSSVDSGELPLRRDAVPLGSLVAGTLPLVERMAHEYGVRVRTGPLGGAVLGDAVRLRQVLLNLLSNAIKYNRAGGSVVVEAHTESAQAGPEICLRVTDTGRGMSPHQLRHAFEPFNRLGVEREGIEGTGIGLSIVKALVERMGGRVAVRSEPARGSAFEVRLPQADESDPLTTLSPPDSLDNTSAPAPESARAARTGRLLYIEDNPVNVMLVSELVAMRPGLRLDVAADGEDGVARAIESRPDLILVDMQLPGIDGHEVRRRLRLDPRTAPIPCIALSANAMPEDIERALQAGFADYWTKPLDFKAFMASIDALFGADETVVSSSS